MKQEYNQRYKCLDNHPCRITRTFLKRTREEIRQIDQSTKNDDLHKALNSVKKPKEDTS